jgi:hypothetical protein
MQPLNYFRDFIKQSPRNLPYFYDIPSFKKTLSSLSYPRLKKVLLTQLKKKGCSPALVKG